MKLLSIAEKKEPQLRICQIISNIVQMGGWTIKDVYYCSDEILLKGLKIMIYEKSLENQIGQRKVYIYSRKEIENLLHSNFPKNTAVISFYDPPNIRTGEITKPVDFKGKAERVFTIPIHDIDIEILEDYNLTFDTYFPEVNNLAKFIHSAYTDGLDIICQCEYGQSRSAACAAAILEHYYNNGISIFSDYRYYPNQLVYHKIFDALEK